MYALIANAVCFVANVGFYAANHHWYNAASAALSFCVFLWVLSWVEP